MKRLPEGGFLGRIVGLCKTVASMRIPVLASHAGYFMVLATFPSLVLILSLLRYTGIEVHNLTQLLEGVIPAALMPAAKRLIVTTYQSTSGTVISISVLTALWSSSKGVYGLLTGLNSVYGAEETRGYWHIRAVSVGYTFLFLLMLLLTLVLQVFGTTLTRLLARWDGFLLRLLTEVIGLRFFVLLGMQTALFTAIFMVLPNGRNSLMDSLPGALLASAGWLVFSNLYSVYVEHFAGYSNIYGSVYAVALSMLWLYCCLSIVFYGGALNRFLMQRRRKQAA